MMKFKLKQDLPGMHKGQIIFAEPCMGDWKVKLEIDCRNEILKGKYSIYKVDFEELINYAEPMKIRKFQLKKKCFDWNPGDIFEERKEDYAEPNTGFFLPKEAVENSPEFFEEITELKF